MRFKSILFIICMWVRNVVCSDITTSADAENSNKDELPSTQRENSSQCIFGSQLNNCSISTTTNKAFSVQISPLPSSKLSVPISKTVTILIPVSEIQTTPGSSVTSSPTVDVSPQSLAQVISLNSEPNGNDKTYHTSGISSLKERAIDRSTVGSGNATPEAFLYVISSQIPVSASSISGYNLTSVTSQAPLTKTNVDALGYFGAMPSPINSSSKSVSILPEYLATPAAITKQINSSLTTGNLRVSLEIKSPFDMHVTNFNCFNNSNNSNIIIYKENIHELTKSSETCLISVLCSLGKDSSYFTVGKLHVYWLRNVSETCHKNIFRDFGDEVSLTGKLSNDTSFVLLNPACRQSQELAYVEFQGKDLSFFPEMCRKLLCYAGVNEVYSESLLTTLVHPLIMSNYDLVDSCQHSLQIEIQSRNISSLPGHTNIFHTSSYPRGSPCTTYTLFTMTDAGSHLILPFRSTWCRPMKRELWEDFLIDSYLGFLSGSQYELYKCIAEKKQLQTSNITEYGKLIQELFGTAISVPGVPRPCVSVICDTNVEIMNILRSNGEVLQWFTHVSFKSEHQILRLRTELGRCLEALNNESANHLDNKAIISVPRTKNKNNLSLFLTVSTSCPDIGNSTDMESQFIKSQILATLSLIHKDLPKFCMPMVCNATARKLSSTLLSVLVPYNGNVNNKCMNKASYRTSYKDSEYIFSFEISKTGGSVVFIVTESYVDEPTTTFFTLLHRGQDARLAICCTNVFEDLIRNRYEFDTDYYYMCPVYSNDSFVFSCLSNQSFWQLKNIGNNQNVLVIDNDLITSKLMTWIATLGINFSLSELRYISDLEFDCLEFLNNIVFVVMNQRLKSPEFEEFTSHMQSTNMKCQKSHHFTVCHKPHGKFQALNHQEGYLLFLHDCFINPIEKDKVFLLLLNKFLGTGPSTEYLCQEDIAAGMVPSVIKKISYQTSGPHTQVISTINKLKAVTPNLPWVMMGDIKSLTVSSHCKRVIDIERIADSLKNEPCIIFSDRESYVALEVKELDSFHFQSFPVGRIMPDRYAWGFTKVTKPFSLFPVKYVIEFSNISIEVNVLDKNPMQKFIKENLGAYTLNQKMSAVQLSKLVMHATLTNNTKCLWDLENQSFFLYSSDTTLWLGPVSEENHVHPCFPSISNDIADIIQDNVKQNMSTINRFWVTCSYNVMISWNKKTFAVNDWDYLLPSCKFNEVFLITINAIPVLFILIGNAYTLTVIMKSSLPREDIAFLIYLCYIAADLLLGIFPCLLMIYDSTSLISGKLTFQDLNPDFWYANVDYISTNKSLDMSYLSFERHGYSSFCGIVLNISIGVSVLTLMLQGLYCFCLAVQKPLHYQHIKAGIYTNWTTVCVLVILVNWRESNMNFTSVLDPITKMTFSMNVDDVKTSPLIYTFLFGAFVFCCFVISAIAIFLCVHRSKRPQPHLMLSDEGNSYQETQLPIFYWMAGLSLSSFLLVFLDSFIGLSNSLPIFHFFSWWGFLALTSVRWAVIFLSKRLRLESRVLFKRREKQTLQTDRNFVDQKHIETLPVHNTVEMNPLDS